MTMSLPNRTRSLSALLLVGGLLVSGCASRDLAARNSVASSYMCQPSPVEGQVIEGSGEYGCYFYLVHPATKQILANTPYQLTVFAPPSSKPQLKRGDDQILLRREGVTDNQGRSFFVRSTGQITPDRMQFVESVGNGGNGASFRLIRPTDGRPMPNVSYAVTGCDQEYKGRTDQQGYTVLVNCKAQEKAQARFFYDY